MARGITEAVKGLCKAKVDQLDVCGEKITRTDVGNCIKHHAISRLNVAMDDAARAKVAKNVCQLREESLALALLEGTTGVEEDLKIRALAQLEN